MMSNRYRASSRRCSVLPASARTRSTSSSKRRQNSQNPPVMSNIQGMRGKMSKNCLWHACQALFLGLLLFSIGAVMSTLGFQADGLLDPNSNSTAVVVSRPYTYNNESRTPQIRFSKLSYAGPIVMGIGGFIIVATCVLTFEARDSAAKVGPASYSGARSAAALYSNPYRSRARSLDVRSVASQTIAETSSATTSFPALHIFDKKALFETFKKFSRTIRTGGSKEDQFHRSPSAPSLLAAGVESRQGDRLAEELDEQACKAAAAGPRRASVLPKMKISSRGTCGGGGPRGQLRQTMSVDCPSSSPFILPSTCKMTTGKMKATTSSTRNVTVVCTPHSSTKDLSGSQTIMPVKSCMVAKGRGAGTPSPVENIIHPTCGRSEVQSPGNGSYSYPKSLPPAPGSSTNGRQSVYKCAATNLNVHFEPATVELHVPNGPLGTNHNLPPSPSSQTSVDPSSDPVPASCVGSSNVTATRTSPRQKPSPRPGPSSSLLTQRSGDRSEDHVMIKSASEGGRSRPRLRTELSCRPILMRQTRVDHSEIISLPDSDDEGFVLGDSSDGPL